jgi:hypothetical protein
LDCDRPLESLLNEDSRVRFDLDGSGRTQSWHWVRSNTAILAWDATGSGNITSGRQLFGSVSWWIFFDNGYEALDALDDNRDGELAGEELNGIVGWLDRNGNGASEPGETTPIKQLGVRAIRVQATSTENGCPANRSGIRMAGGRVLPTYDWIATPVDAKRPRDASPLFAAISPWMFTGVPAILALASRRRRSAYPCSRPPTSSVPRPSTTCSPRGWPRGWGSSMSRRARS